VSSEWLVVSDY